MSAGQNSNSHYGLLQQVMKTARNDWLIWVDKV
jgi:hypothetical protein